MADADFNFGAVDAAFRSLCKILFGREVGGLRDFEPYLKEAMTPYTIAKSSVSGREVFLSNPFYPKGAIFVAPDEVSSLESRQVSINDIKDIDSLFRAASESMAYCGNKVFGKNINIGFVDNAIDCIDVYHCHNVRNVKRGAYLSYVRESECVFGIPAFPKIRHSMRCLEGINANRMFETYYSNFSSDMYYSFNCYSCSDVIFGFNLRGKRHVVGNIQLSQGKYAELKKKLTAEMADELEKNKRVFSISDLAMMGLDGAVQLEKPQNIPTVPAPQSVENAWATAGKIVLGAEHRPIAGFVPWLQKNALPVRRLKGKFGTHTYRPALPLVKGIPAACICTREEAMAKNGPLAQEGELAAPLRQLARLVAKKAAITMEMVEGACREVPEVTQAIDSTESWSMWDATTSTRSACYSAVIESSYIFGGYLRALNSEFCINCYDVVKARRSFEVDGCSECNACYFCHNLEGCEECIFCCNAKGLRHAVFNTQLPKEEYLRVKRMLLDYVNAELSKNRSLRQGVFHLAKTG